MAVTHKHKRFPEKLAFLLNNPIRRHYAAPEKLLAKFQINPEDVVVDFGCGPGYFTIPLARIAQKVIGVDVSKGMLEKAAAYAKKNGVALELFQSDGTRIDLPDGSVDVIVLIHVFHEIEDRTKVLLEFVRILKHSGRVLIVEKTLGGLLASRVGPPVVSSSVILGEVTNAGLHDVGAVTHGNDSIIQGKKS
jgi:2-polyprenyl-3-methyl-5-hydroxy-6-metoxy-1,4-benzoquinol methylase